MIIKRAIDLIKGDVMVDPEGKEHLIEYIYSDANLGAGIIEIFTTTGIHLHKSGFTRYDTYDVKD